MVTMAKYHVFSPMGNEAQAKECVSAALYLECVNFGPIKAPGTSGKFKSLKKGRKEALKSEIF